MSRSKSILRTFDPSDKWDVDKVKLWSNTAASSSSSWSEFRPSMAHRPNMSPGLRTSAASGPNGFPVENQPERPNAGKAGYDIADLFAKFEQNSGGTLSPQFAADLALDIVLNEIVEQACLATRASGAAVVLRRGDEFVCRASTGASAPTLGARMDDHSGLSGLCIQTGQTQRCDDTQRDPRADREASQRLGVRSVMVLPLARNAEIVGVLEVMSERSTAFDQQDERTLGVLAGRALRNLERAADPFLLRADVSAAAVLTIPSRFSQEPPAPRPVFEAPVSGPIFGAVAPRTSRHWAEVLTWGIGLILLGATVFIGILTSRHLGWRGSRVNAQAGHVSSPVPPQPANPKSPSGAMADPIVSSALAVPVSAGVPVSNSPRPQGNAAATSSAAVPDGGLRIYENGKQIFRLAGSRGQAGTNVAQLSPAVQASLIHRVDPEYPESARARKLQGKVVLEIRVRPDGEVEDIQLVSGQPELAQAAIDAVQQWKFKPQAGNANAAMQTQVTLNFRLP
ncbi:MAG: TonB family protein [Candidatus Sulfotelmatobacter sp.]